MLKRADTQLRRPRAPLDRGELEFRWELFEDIIDEALPLLRRHYAELGLPEPLNPDWRSLFFMSGFQKRLRIATMRDEDGRLVGYCAGWCINYLASQDVKVIMVNALYIEDTYRGSLRNLRTFLEMMVEYAQEMKAIRLEMAPQGRHRKGIGRLLRHMGWKASPDPAWQLDV